MTRGWFLATFALCGLAAVLIGSPDGARAQETGAVQWVWSDEGDPATNAPAGTRYFRQVFRIDRPLQKPVDEAQLDITADNAFTVWVNGAVTTAWDDCPVPKGHVGLQAEFFEIEFRSLKYKELK